MLDLAAPSAGLGRRQACKAYNGIPHAQAAGSKAYEIGPSWEERCAVSKRSYMRSAKPLPGIWPCAQVARPLFTRTPWDSVEKSHDRSRRVRPGGWGRPGQARLAVLDRTRWHVSAQVHVPTGLHLHAQPPYAPERQPAERLWPLTNAALANKHFHDIHERQEVQTQHCLALQALPHVIQAHTHFHWWPTLA